MLRVPILDHKVPFSIRTQNLGYHLSEIHSAAQCRLPPQSLHSKMLILHPFDKPSSSYTLPKKETCE